MTAPSGTSSAPRSPPEQAQCYSGKKKDHTVKNVLLVNALLHPSSFSVTPMVAASMISHCRLTPPPYLRGVGCCRIWAFWPSRFPTWKSSCRTKIHRRGADMGTAESQSGAAPPPAAHRACQQQCQALSYRQRPDPSVEGGRSRSGDGTLLCPAQLPGAPHALATNDFIGINSMLQSRFLARSTVSSKINRIRYNSLVVMSSLIGKYLSRLRKLDHAIVLKVGFEP